MNMITADFLVIGGGIAGVSVAAHLAAHGKVILIERESYPGYHSTGRSAALFSETYGNRTVRALTRAGRGFYESFAGGLARTPILAPRGFLLYALPGQADTLGRTWARLAARASNLRLLSATEACALVPVLRSEMVEAAIYEANARDIDVHELYSSYLRLLRSRGGRMVLSAPALSMSFSDSWRVKTPAGEFISPVIVNAAGAWADEVAALARLPGIGLVPKRRTALIITTPSGVDLRGWPMTCDVEETVYFKPDASKLLISPADETPMSPCDVQPDELDVAIAIARFQQVTKIEVQHIEKKWAGLRSFVADKTPVVGFDPLGPGFFWVAGQGGYGIQTAEGVASTATALITEGQLPKDVVGLGVNMMVLSPSRFNNRQC
jgi:D-arginine dehydrogenase